MSDDTKAKAAPDMTIAHNALQQMETFLNILKRTPDLEVHINDALNFFYICMPFFKNKVFYENVFGEFYTKDHPESTMIKATIDMMMLRYKAMFGFEEVPLLTQEMFDLLTLQGMVFKEEYEQLTGLKDMIKMDPRVEAQFKAHNIDINDLNIDPSKMETLHLDPNDMETIQLDDQNIGSPLLDDAISDILKEKINKTN